MKKTFTFSLIFLFITTYFIFGFTSNDKNPNTKIDFENTGNIISSPGIIKEPALDNPLSPLLESFEGSTFPPAGWSKINVISGATGWERIAAGTTPVPGFIGGVIITPPGGGNWVAFCNWVTGSNYGVGPSNQWLVTPQLVSISPADSLRFWLRKYGGYIDHMDIKISTTNPSPPSAFTFTVSLLSFQAADSGYLYYKYNIGAIVPTNSNIYIGFREWAADVSVDGTSFSLDLVQVTAPVGVRNIYFGEANSYKLEQNYPNPFNPSTKITYSIERDGFVNLAVYDILGHEVAVIVNTIEQAGNYTVNFDASKLSSGIYFYKLTSGSFTEIKKMNLIK